MDRNTGGRIKKAPTEYDRDTTFSLLNALYFAAAWRSPFDPNDTSDQPFTKSGGEEINVPTMHQDLELVYAEGAGWRAVELPYAEGFAMRLVLPGSGADPETLTAATLAEIVAALDTDAEVSVLISSPKWDHKSSFHLRRVLGSLGLAKTLVTTADFDVIQPRLTITQAAQAANITVAEKGTVAAAVTQIDGAVTGAPPWTRPSTSTGRSTWGRSRTRADGWPTGNEIAGNSPVRRKLPANWRVSGELGGLGRPAPAFSRQQRRHLSYELVRHRLPHPELQRPLRRQARCDGRAERLVAVGHGVHGHMMCPAGEIDHIRAADRDRRDAVADHLPGIRHGSAAAAPDFLKDVLHLGGE
ncbi:hypothetical protein ABIB51_002414 [Arthrobacter sp. UYCu712]